MSVPAGSGGIAVSVSGDGLTVLAGVYTAASLAGAASVFKYSAGAWGAGTAIGSPTGVTQFGYGCALNYDGTIAAVSYAYSTRRVDIFRYSGGVWSAATALTPNPSGYTSFVAWYSMAFSNTGNSLIAGSSTGGNATRPADGR